MGGSHTRNIVIVLLSISFRSVRCNSEEKPDFVKTCYKNAEDFDNCSTESVNGIFEALKKGYPPWDLPPLDPLILSQVQVLQAGDGPVSLNASLSSVNVTGLGKAYVTSNRVDPKTYSFTTQLKVPHLRLEAGYSLMGRALLLPIIGSGDAWFEPSDMNVTSHQDVLVFEKDGVKFFSIEDVKVDFTVKSLKMRMNNLYNGLKQLEETTNVYLNENWQIVLESLKPILTLKIRDILIELLNRVFDKVPAKYFIGDID